MRFYILRKVIKVGGIIVIMKLREFQLYLKKNKIGAAVFTHPDPCITYFTQMVPSHAVLCITPKKATFLITQLDKMKKVEGIEVQYFDKD